MLDGREKAQKAISPHCRGMEKRMEKMEWSLSKASAACTCSKSMRADVAPQTVSTSKTDRGK
jgi:organic hydroperoxide reductase OsmC/OhrA